MNGRPHDRQLEAALQAGRARRYREAVEILSAILRSSDEYPEAVLYLGRAYHALGEYARAIAVLTFFVRLAPSSAAGHFFLGRSYLAFGRPQPALRHLRRSVALRPAFAPSLSLAGVACLRCRRTEEAVGFLERAVEAAPESKPVFTAYLNALLTQAIRLFRAGDLTMAGQMLQFILRHHEESLTAHLYLGRILRDLGKPLPALPHFEAALLLAPDDPALHLQVATVLLQAGQTDRAMEELRRAATAIDAKAFLTRDPTELARLLAVSHFQSGQYRDAIGYGLRVLKEQPGEPHLHVIVAESFRNLGQLQKARNHYERAVESREAGADALYGLAMVLLEQGNLEELRDVLSRIDRRAPGDPTAAYYLAICRSRLGEDPAVTVKLLQEQVRARGPDPFLMLALAADYMRAGLPELAAGWFRKTLKVREHDREAMFGLVEATEALGDEEAHLRSLKELLAAYPEEHALRKDLVKLLVARGDHAGAEEHVERLIPVEPANRTLRELLATCYRRTGRFGDAIVLLKELIIADPRSEDTLKALVYCMDRSGDGALAARVLEKALPTFPKSTELRLILGVLLMRSGELERAATIFREVISTSPGEAAAYENLGHIHKKQGDELFAEKFYARARAARTRRSGAKAAAPASPKPAPLRAGRRRR